MRGGPHHSQEPPEFGPGVSLRDQGERALACMGEEPALLIYDNATRSASIDAWLPPSGARCHVIVTSVDERLLADWPEVHVGPLPTEVSLDLISQLVGPELAGRHGRALAETAGGLPVQIVPASRALAYVTRALFSILLVLFVSQFVHVRLTLRNAW